MSAECGRLGRFLLIIRGDTNYRDRPSESRAPATRLPLFLFDRKILIQRRRGLDTAHYSSGLQNLVKGGANSLQSSPLYFVHRSAYRQPV